MILFYLFYRIRVLGKFNENKKIKWNSYYELYNNNMNMNNTNYERVYDTNITVGKCLTIPNPTLTKGKLGFVAMSSVNEL